LAIWPRCVVDGSVWTVRSLLPRCLQLLASESMILHSMKLAGAPHPPPGAFELAVHVAVPRSSLSAALAHTELVGDYFWTSADVFVDVLPAAVQPKAVAAGEEKPKAVAAVGEKPRAAADASARAVIADALREADASFEKKNLRQADELWAEVLKLDPANAAALVGRAKVHLDAGRPRKASKLLEQALAEPLGRTAATLMLLGEARRQAGSYDQAIEAFDKAGVLLPMPKGEAPAATQWTRLDAIVGAARSMLDQGNDVGAVGVLNRVLSLGEGHVGVLLQYSRVTLLKGDLVGTVGTLMRAVVMHQQHREAKEAFAEAISQPGGVSALLRMVESTKAGASSALGFLGIAARDWGACGSAASLLAHAFEAEPTNPVYALNLVHCLEHVGALQLALDFAKEFFRRNARVRLSRVVKGSKVAEVGDSSGFTLKEVHDVIEGVRDLFACVRAKGLPCPPLAATPPSAAAVTALFDELVSSFARESFTASVTRTGTDGRPSHPGKALRGIAPTVLTNDGSRTVHGAAFAKAFKRTVPSAAAQATASKEADALASALGSWSCAWEALPVPFARIQPAAEGPTAASSEGMEGSAIASSEYELEGGAPAHDTMALVMTVVKLLHAAGNVPVLPPLVRIVERARKGTALHLTLARNEAAYYGCIAQSLPMLRAPSTLPVVFFLGDSHTVAPAWQSIRLPQAFVSGDSSRTGTTEALLAPALVTGVKAWHLRPASKFYPRVNWDAVTLSLPPGSPVLLSVGEIDCREGILVAVQKKRYNTVRAGIQQVVAILCNQLQRLVRECRFRFLVCPAPPVLDPTRDIVRKFNKELQSQLAEMGPEVKFLDFEADLLSEDGSSFRSDQYGLDGTHMSPAVLRLVERCA
jgi:tetratricopeptide (TPR) repeat protein